jgi:hypothetical protein
MTAFICILIIQGCTPRQALSNQLFDNQCEIPCWGGIYPGKSTIYDAHNTLVLLENIDPRSIYFVDMGDESILVNSEFETSELIYIYQDDGTVSEIVFTRLTNITLTDVINNLGDPDEYLAGGISRGDAIVYRILVVSDKGYIAGMTLNMYEKEEFENSGIPEDHDIDGLIFFREDMQEVALERNMSIYLEDMERFPWR